MLGLTRSAFRCCNGRTQIGFLFPTWLLLVLLMATGSVRSVDMSYYADWGTLASRPNQPTCMDIPKNMTLCHDIGYSKMRLPNLLDHDTMAEVSQQASSWVPLLNIKCHADTQLFLCSLFSPVCLDRPIYPCRSLCEKVKTGCEGRMRVYGFPWPDILRCEKFPLDNDMCIASQSTSSGEGGACAACKQAETYENILDNFCRAEFAIRTKVKKLKKSKVICKKSKVYKTVSLDKKEMRQIRRPIFTLDNIKECCGNFGRDAKDNYLIMGVRKGSELLPTFIMQWHGQAKTFRNAVRRFKTLDCSDPKMVSESMLAEGMPLIHGDQQPPPARKDVPFPKSKSNESRQRVAKWSPKRRRAGHNNATIVPP